MLLLLSFNLGCLLEKKLQSVICTMQALSQAGCLQSPMAFTGKCWQHKSGGFWLEFVMHMHMLFSLRETHRVRFMEGCTDWTDEKHDLYLDYLETSFVRQLYCLLGGKTHKSFRSHDPPANSYKSTDQFAVQENGCWQKIKLEKKQIHVDASYDFYSRENLSTSGFVHPNIDCYADTAFRRTSMGNPAGKIEYRSCRECSNGSTAESSGQNFKDEDKEDNPSASPVPKRHKRDAEIDSSISYQTFKGCSVQEGKSK